MRGVLFVCGKSQHRRKITLKKNPKLVLLRNKPDPGDQGPDGFSGLRSGGLVLQAVMEGLVGNRTLHFRFKIRSVVTFMELT